MRNRVLFTIIALLPMLLDVGTAKAIDFTPIASCSTSDTTTDSVDRGFYLTHYPGNNLTQVQLNYAASSGFGGLWSVTLTARRGTFDGPLLGTHTITLEMGDVNQTDGRTVTFDFGGVPVTPGDTITFKQTAQRILGGGKLYFDTGKGKCPHVFETYGTSPPLDTFRRHTVGVYVSQEETTTACIASDTVLCIDKHPGDRRFEVTVTFHTSQGGGISGSGQAIPGAPVGISEGGFFWFFQSASPDMLVKIVNGCGVNSHFWAFLSAGTNVGFDVTVLDTKTGHSAVYHNPDLTAALPVQDTNALPCP